MALPDGYWPLHEAGFSFGRRLTSRSSPPPFLTKQEIALSLRHGVSFQIGHGQCGRLSVPTGVYERNLVRLQRGEFVPQEASETLPVTSREIWRYIAGYFDGDGSVDVDANAYTLRWVLSFSDNWLDQILFVKALLEQGGIRVQKPRRTGVGGWRLVAAEIESVRKMAINMLESGGLHEKRSELLLLLAYYDNKVTGKAVAEVLNYQVSSGARIGKIRQFNIPFTYSQGLREAIRASVVGGKSLGQRERKQLVEDHVRLLLSGKQLALKYGVSRATVSRVINRCRRSTRDRPET